MAAFLVEEAVASSGGADSLVKLKRNKVAKAKPMASKRR